MVLSTPCTYTDIHVNVHQSDSCFKRDDYLIPLSVSASIYYAVTTTQKPPASEKDSLSQVQSCVSQRKYSFCTEKNIPFEQGTVPLSSPSSLGDNLDPTSITQFINSGQHKVNCFL